MNKIFIKIPNQIYSEIWTHLLPKRFIYEEAAFLYVNRTIEKESETFSYLEWVPVPPEGFLHRSAVNFELTDQTRAAVIKRAHELGASIIELHSHKGVYPAAFSPSDIMGFEDFVPHIWWRLKGRPYIAIVASRSGFDSLAWITGPSNPQLLTGINIETSLIKPTNNTWRNLNVRQTF